MPDNTRREFVLGSLAATAALATFVPAQALGREGKVAPSEKITLGAGLRPRRGLPQVFGPCAGLISYNKSRDRNYSCETIAQ